MIRWAWLGNGERIVCAEAELRLLADSLFSQRPDDVEHLICHSPSLLLMTLSGYFSAASKPPDSVAALVAWLRTSVRDEGIASFRLKKRRAKLHKIHTKQAAKFFSESSGQPKPKTICKGLIQAARKLTAFKKKRQAQKFIDRMTTKGLAYEIAARLADESFDLFREAKDSERLHCGLSQPSSPQLPQVADEPIVERQSPATAILNNIRQSTPSITEFQSRLESEKLESLRQLAYGASHEINNPLANIVIRADVLLRAETNEDRRKKLNVIKQQAMRAHEMISDLMLFANPPKSKFQACDLPVLLEAVIDELRTEFTGSCPTIECSCAESGEVVCDPTQIAEAIKAIVRNAIEATPQAGLISLEFQVDDDGNSQIRVQDTGAGIDDRICRHMFDPFFSGREAGRGLGFGLSKAWRIAQLHGGQLQCTMREPGSTCFEFHWPKLEPMAAVAAA